MRFHNAIIECSRSEYLQSSYQLVASKDPGAARPLAKRRSTCCLLPGRSCGHPLSDRQRPGLRRRENACAPTSRTPKTPISPRIGASQRAQCRLQRLVSVGEASRLALLSLRSVTEGWLIFARFEESVDVRRSTRRRKTSDSASSGLGAAEQPPLQNYRHQNQFVWTPEGVINRSLKIGPTELQGDLIVNATPLNSRAIVVLHGDGFDVQAGIEKVPHCTLLVPAVLTL